MKIIIGISGFFQKNFQGNLESYFVIQVYYFYIKMFVDDFSKVMQQENVHLDVIYVPSGGGVMYVP